MYQQPNCAVCEKPLSFKWTDTHGVGACIFCGMPYEVYHYAGEGDDKKRVEGPPIPAIKDAFIPIAKRYHAETHGRVFPGSYDMGILSRRGTTYSGATAEDMNQWDEWCEAHKDELPKPEEIAHTTAEFAEPPTT